MWDGVFLSIPVPSGPNLWLASEIELPGRSMFSISNSYRAEEYLPRPIHGNDVGVVEVNVALVLWRQCLGP